MSQYDFGTIDPFVVDGTTLAGMLNNWRDALYSLHRGSARPDYAVPGLLWINDVGGPTNWLVNIYLGPSVGDRPILQINTTTGAIAQVADQITASVLAAQAAANPSLVLNATGNGADLKSWRTLVDAAGLLRFQSLTDAGVVQSEIKSERNGRVHVVAPPDGDDSDLVPTTHWVKTNMAAGQVATPTYDASTTGQASGTNYWSAGDVPFLITQGTQIFSRNFTAVDPTHPIEVEALISLFAPNSLGSHGVLGIFIDGAANAAAMTQQTVQAGCWGHGKVYWQGVLSAGPHTFTVRLGSYSTAGIYTMMNDSGHQGGGSLRNTMVVREVGVGPQGPRGQPGLPGSTNDVLQKQYNNIATGTYTGTYDTATGTQPTSAGGTLLMAANVTPQSAASRIDFDIQIKGIAYSANQVYMLALFDSLALIDCAAFWVPNGPAVQDTLTFRTSYPSPGTTPRTYNLRIGANSGAPFGLNQTNNTSTTPPQSGAKSWFNIFERAP